ncbi:MAG: nitroreductase family protein [Paracoccaceae bacterium]
MPISNARPHPDVVEFLLSRRSRPAKTLATEPVPSEAEIQTILTAAARTPDHGKLAPWRFLIIAGAARERLAAAALAHGAASGLAPADAEKAATQFRQGAVIIAVVASPKPSAKIPRWEQELSAGAVCLAALNAALALGWGANWLTGPFARDASFLGQLGLASDEFVAGYIHIGRETLAPSDRDRPDLAALVTRL